MCAVIPVNTVDSFVSNCFNPDYEDALRMSTDRWTSRGACLMPLLPYCYNDEGLQDFGVWLFQSLGRVCLLSFLFSFCSRAALRQPKQGNGGTSMEDFA